MSVTSTPGGSASSGPPGSRDSRGAGRPLLWGTLALAGLLALGGVGVGAGALVGFLGAGPAPAEALPENTVAYAAVDLDPSGEQKVAALRTLTRFPAVSEELGVSSGDDLGKRVVQGLQQQGTCSNLDYDTDLAPWVGSAFGAAALPAEEQPDVVLVLEVADEGAAEDGARALAECAGGAAAVQDGWVVLAENEDVLDTLRRAREQGSLADRADFRQRIDDVGGQGIARAYLSPEAGTVLADSLGGLPLPLPGGSQSLRQQLEDFGGMATSLRFESDGITLEYAAETGEDPPTGIVSSDAGAGQVVGSLPTDTVAALGVGWSENWLGAVFERLGPLASLLGPGGGAEELMAQAENATGLDLPQEGETLLGDAAALAVGPGLDAATLQRPDPRSLPVGLRVQGDPEAARPVLEKLRSRVGEEQAGLLAAETEGDVLAYGPSEQYREALAEGGDLGGTDRFQRVLPEVDDAAAMLYVDFDGDDDWVASLARETGQDEVAANLEPLRALGVSSSFADGVARVEVRVGLE